MPALGDRRLRLLLIEDDLEVVARLREAFELAGIDVVVAEALDDAVSRTDEGGYDLVVCDLVIPPSVGGEATTTEHGLVACDHARERLPGTPVWIYSAFGTLDDLKDRLSEAPQEDLLGTGGRPLLRAFSKGKPEQLKQAVVEYAEELRALQEDVAITWGADPHELAPADARIMRIYSRQRGGEVVRLRQLAGGRSGAVTLWTEVEEPEGGISGRVVAKLNSLAEIEDEERRVEEHAAHVLAAPVYAGSLHAVKAGTRDRAGLFYSLAAGYDRTLFDLLAESPDEAAKVVQQISNALEPWHANSTPAPWTVRHIRRLLVRDEKLGELRVDADWATSDLEGRRVPCRRCRSHGDLHGSNVLVNGGQRGMLIDFARAGFATAPLDPITLELSAVLHPDSRIDLQGWPTQEQAANWAVENDYVEGSPIKPFVQACRQWMYKVQRTDREAVATVYAYALRQLRYGDVDLDLAAAFSKGAATRVLAD